MNQKAIELLKRNIDHIEMILDNTVFGPRAETRPRLKNIVSELNQAIAELKKQPDLAKQHGSCLCCGDYFSKDEEVYVGAVHTRCRYKNKKQPELCKTCKGSKQLLGNIDAPGKSCDGLPMPYPCPDCQPAPALIACEGHRLKTENKMFEGYICFVVQAK